MHMQIEWRWIVPAVIGGFAMVSGHASAQTAPAEGRTPPVITSTPQAPRPLHEDPGSFISFELDNDVFANTDRGYTNGFRFAYTSSETGTPDWLANAARAFPLFPDAAPIRSTLSFGQNLYTPKDISLHDPDPNDRPYAAWLYGSAAVLADSGDRLDRLELQLGVVGPYAIGEQVQNTVHSIIGSKKARGWNHQLHNEPGVILSYERTWRSLYAAAPLGIGFDLSPYVGASLGNVLTQASVGATARLGFDLPADYGPPRIRPSVPGSDFFIPTSGFSWYLFASIEGRAVARNIFLDGNTFEDSPHVTKNPLVGDLQIGLAVQVYDLRLAYTHVYRTQEFEEQKDHFSQYGMFTASWRF
jgi:lipid A 3-O-deacylase